MAKLYGTVTGDDKQARTTRATKEIDTWLQTEHGRLHLHLSVDGSWRLSVVPVHKSGSVYETRETEARTLASGNVNEKVLACAS